jgi:hypothetical protein
MIFASPTKNALAQPMIPVMYLTVLNSLWMSFSRPEKDLITTRLTVAIQKNNRHKKEPCRNLQGSLR